MRRASAFGRFGRAIAIAVAALVTVGGAPLSLAAAETETMTVCPTCEISSLAEAIASAPAGARVEVHGGVYPGGLVIEKPVTLVGIDGPVIDGGGSGTLLQVRGAEVAIEGFTFRATGSNHDREDAAIVFDGGRAVITGNRIEDALFGIYLKQAHGSIVRDNVILAKQVDVAMRGDGIKVWYSNDTLIENNVAQDGRDVILWYANGGTVRGNDFDRNRYGLHLMFSNGIRIEGNSLDENSIGLYVMYGRDITIVGNSLSNNHGPSGGGLGFKDVDNAVVEGNRFVANQIGAQVDTSPVQPGVENLWRGNVFAFNDIGIGLTPSVRHNIFTENSFIDNTEHVSVLGRGQLRDLTWAVDGRGNYWSDYAGYDADGDGVGDRPYRSQRLFESLMDERPVLRLFQFSPAALALDFAAKAFPEVRPETKFEDPAPLMQAPRSPYLPPVAAAPTGSRLALGVASSLALIASLAVVLRLRPVFSTAKRGSRPAYGR